MGCDCKAGSGDTTCLDLHVHALRWAAKQTREKAGLGPSTFTVPNATESGTGGDIWDPFPMPPDPTPEQVICFSTAYYNYLHAEWLCIEGYTTPAAYEACSNAAKLDYHAAWFACFSV